MCRSVGMLFLLAASMAGYATDNPCLIVKHATASQQVWVSGANWRHVDGDFPAGMKWKSDDAAYCPPYLLDTP